MKEEGEEREAKERGKTKERRVSSPHGYLATEVICVARRHEERKRGKTERFVSPSRDREAQEREKENKRERHRERKGERGRENFLPLTSACTRVQGDKREERGSARDKERRNGERRFSTRRRGGRREEEKSPPTPLTHACARA